MLRRVALVTTQRNIPEDTILRTDTCLELSPQTLQRTQLAMDCVVITI
jgi:hypothetical protein